MKELEIDQRIRADCHCLGKWGNCWIMLHRDSTVRWLVIVPETDAGEWHDLDKGLRDQLAFMASSLGAGLKKKLSCDKINIAAIGNIVPQFHFHVIGRWKNDPYWPGVVWGRSSIDAEYTQQEVEELRMLCLDALNGREHRD